LLSEFGLLQKPVIVDFVVDSKEARVVDLDSGSALESLHAVLDRS